MREAPLDGAEGVLLTDSVRSRGGILVNNQHGERRTRFSIGHELGHFLLDHHLLHGEYGFQCRSADMRECRFKTRDQLQESEANRFAIALLAPRHAVASALEADPDLSAILPLRSRLNVSLEALIRRIIALHTEPLAAVWSRAGRVRYLVRHGTFPWIPLDRGDPLPDLSAARALARQGRRGVTRMREAHPLAWTSRENGELFEQTRLGKDGHAVTLLWWAGADDLEPQDVGLAELGMPGFR